MTDEVPPFVQWDHDRCSMCLRDPCECAPGVSGAAMTQPNENDLRYIRHFADKCCAEVSRNGESQPCDKTAVAVAIDAEDEHWWPVCGYHTRARRMVPLADLLACVRSEQP